MKKSMIEVKDFRKVYGNYVAVDGISFDVQQGEIFGLLGPNGAGKTSTLECLEGLRAPSGGSMRVAGMDPARETHKLRNLIGVQLQSAGLPESITPDEAMMQLIRKPFEPTYVALVLLSNPVAAERWEQLVGGGQERWNPTPA